MKLAIPFAAAALAALSISTAGVSAMPRLPDMSGDEASALAVQFSARFKWDQAQLWYLAGAIGWALLGYAAFVFHIAQLRAYPRARGKTQAG